jgi:hypothetical protein
MADLWRVLRRVDELAELDPERRLKLMAAGGSVGELQGRYIEHASAIALAVIAEQLVRIADHFDVEGMT